MFLKMKKNGVSFEQIFTDQNELNKTMLTLLEMGFIIDDSDVTSLPIRKEVINDEIH